ncbi:Arm DNA-binding domain-containing protein [Acinetobacter sp. C_3_1]|uniref:Arm DNA-binding domain-containing protein n=1 Tax=unclassified Acinetobacter TaxID=196816 RepID=UPI003964780B
MSLTDVLCKKALPKEKQYRLSDSNGLSLRIDPNGKKYWSRPCCRTVCQRFAEYAKYRYREFKHHNQYPCGRQYPHEGC